MKDPNLFEDLVAVSPGMEIWWDSSPCILDNWYAKMLAKADDADKPVLEAQFARMYNADDPMSQLFRGVTTNPPLSLAAFKDDPARWEKVAQKVIADNPGLDTEGLFWVLYKEVVRQGSDMFLPLFEASGYKEGFLSGQVDPRSAFDGEAMLAQALEIHAVNPNVMVKVPGTAQGYEIIEELTSRGIATNNTLTFVLSQLLDCAKSVMRGLEKAKANGVDLSKWRSVITHMEARYGDLGGLREAGAEVGVEVTEADVRYAELAIFKKAYRTRQGARLPEQDALLLAAPRPDDRRQAADLAPRGEGRRRHRRHLPAVASSTRSSTSRIAEDITFKPNQIDVDPPADVMEKLLKIPYFARAYDEDGYTREEYNTHPALVKTHEAFSKATNEMVAFADSCLKGNCKA